MNLDWIERYNVITLEEVDSTNSEALRIASSGTSNDVVVLSKIQTSGRGTKRKCWDSLSGNLHTSILLKTAFDLKKNSQLSFLAANAVYETIKHFAKEDDIKLDIKLKWPNDVLIDSKKIAGILLESVSLKDNNYIIVGVGVNIDKAPNINKKVTCIRDLGMKAREPSVFLNTFMTKFEKLYQQWKDEGSFIRTRKNWMNRAYNLNKSITVDDGVRRISGFFKAINLDGSIRLKLASGQYCNISSGEVLFQGDV